jgi:hypothetical protein
MAGSRDSSDISLSNIIEPTWEALSADEQLQFEEHKERMIQEAKAKFLADFKVDRNNKVVRHRATDPASLQPTPNIPNVSNTNELQSLRNYVEEQREQMQNIIGGMQSDFKRLVRAFDKSNIANFPSHEVELGGNTRNTSATGCRDQSCRRSETGGSLGPTSECRRVPQPRWVEREGEREGGRSEAAGDRRERGGNLASFVFVPRPGRVRLQ